MPHSSPLHIVFCLFPGHPLFCLASALDVLRHANRKSGKTVYRWSIVTEDNQIVTGSNNLPINPTAKVNELANVDRVFLVAGFYPEKLRAPNIANWLRKNATDDMPIGGLSNGAFVLAYYGLLDTYHATVHWEDFSSFCALYPAINARYQRFVIDQNRITCSGGAATLDLFVELVRQDLGNDLSVQVSRQMLLQDFTNTQDPEGNHVFDGSHRYSSRVQRALSLMEAGVENRLNVTELAAKVGISRRALLRAFRKETGHTPTKILNDRRLERARSLVLHSHLPLIAIADSVGFSSQSHMTKSYRENFGITPAKDRLNVTSIPK